MLGGKPALPSGGFDVTDVDLKTLTPRVWERIRQTNDPAVRLLHGGVPVRVVHVPENRQDRRPTYVLQSLEPDRLRHEVAQSRRLLQGRKKSDPAARPAVR